MDYVSAPGMIAVEPATIVASRLRCRRRLGSSDRWRPASFSVAGDELPEALRRSVREQLLRRALRLDLALMQEHHPVRDVAGKAHLVGNDQHGAPLFRQA